MHILVWGSNFEGKYAKFFTGCVLLQGEIFVRGVFRNLLAMHDICTLEYLPTGTSTAIPGTLKTLYLVLET